MILFGSVLCMNNILDLEKVVGKIVICIWGVNGWVEKGGIVKEVGGMGMIFVNNVVSGEEFLVDFYFLLVIMIMYFDGLKFLSYINSFRLDFEFCNCYFGIFF